MDSPPWNRGAVVIVSVIVNDMVESETLGRVATRRMARSAIVGEMVSTIALNPHFFCIVWHIHLFVLKFSLGDVSECRARDGEVKTELLTGRSAHAYFSRCAPCSTVVSYLFKFHPMHLQWLMA